MKSLSVNWFIEGSVDFERKKYQLLAYLQQINQHFNKTKLYPDLNDLIFHYNNLLKFKENKAALQQAFPERLTNADLEALKLTYDKMVKDDSLMQQIEHIISYSIRKMDPAIKEGKEIYDFVESRIRIEAIGVIPLYPYHGYLLLRNGDEKVTKVYEYQVTIFEGKDEKYRGINTSFVTSFERNFIYTPEAIRKELIHKRREVPNPAVYHVETDITFPFEQTLLPLAKRSLVKHISTAA
ncbi:hypothetical protein [Desertivirga xinjiangensis]|uniref:hypothetical protein n=1 Tax=Desertivirga xinjiangensis TaxID=539206 RepID=UPI00210E40FC|nr:hypothetical protein [Pedobacter xinjiangensis]